MSRTNAGGWLALAVVAAVFGASVAIRQAPGQRADAVSRRLLAGALSLSAMQSSIPAFLQPVAEPLPASRPQPAANRRAPVARPAREGVAKDAIVRSVRLQADLAVATEARDSVPREVDGPAPLVARRLPLAATPVVGSAVSGAVRRDDSDTRGAAGATSAAPEPEPDGAVRRAFSTAGRGISGGFRTAGSAIRGAF